MGTGYEYTDGIDLRYGDTAEAAAATDAPSLGAIKDISDLGKSVVDKFEVTRVNQYDGEGNFDPYKKKKPGRVDPGVITGQLGLDDTDVEAGYGLLRLEKFWEIRFPSGSIKKGQGFLSQFGEAGKVNDEATVGFEITCSDAWTFTPAA